MSTARSFASASTPGSEHGSDAVEELARRHPSLVALMRAGWVAKGAVYVVLGLLAGSLVVAGGGSSQEVSQTGAVEELAGSPLGAIGLWLVAGGLVLYVLWRLVSIALPAESAASTWATRAGYAVSAAVYATLAWTAASIASSGGGSSGSSSGGGSQESQVDSATSSVLEMTAGRWIVGLAGLAVVALGGYFAYRGTSREFREDIEPGDVGPVSGHTIETLGVAGWVGRGVMTALVGWFLVQAALSASGEEAQGLDGTLRETASSGIGAVLVVVVAVGLVLHGVYCVLAAPKARLHGAD